VKSFGNPSTILRQSFDNPSTSSGFCSGYCSGYCSGFAQDLLRTGLAVVGYRLSGGWWLVIGGFVYGLFDGIRCKTLSISLYFAAFFKKLLSK
jgi:hypothetical protein